MSSITLWKATSDPSTTLDPMSYIHDELMALAPTVTPKTDTELRAFIIDGLMAKFGNKYTHPYDVEYLLAYIVGNMDVTATARVATTAAYDHDNCSTVSSDGGVALTAGEEELPYRLSLTGGHLRDYVQVDPAIYANDSTWRW